MSYDLTGKIEVIQATQEITEKFKKREFVIEQVDGEYSQHIKLQFTQDKCNLLDKYNVGDTVTVGFNLRGRPYTKDGKTTYFTNLDAWRISAEQNTATEQPVITNEAVENDLPF